MPNTTPPLNVHVEIRTIVREEKTGRLLFDVATTGVAEKTVAHSIAEATAPALSDALANHARMVNAYRTEATRRA